MCASKVAPIITAHTNFSGVMRAFNRIVTQRSLQPAIKPCDINDGSDEEDIDLSALPIKIAKRRADKKRARPAADDPDEVNDPRPLGASASTTPSLSYVATPYVNFAPYIVSQHAGDGSNPLGLPEPKRRKLSESERAVISHSNNEAAKFGLPKLWPVDYEKTGKKGDPLVMPLMDTWNTPEATILRPSQNFKAPSADDSFCGKYVLRGCYVDSNALAWLGIKLHQPLNSGAFGKVYSVKDPLPRTRSSDGGLEYVVKMTNLVMRNLGTLTTVTSAALNEDRIGKIAAQCGIGPQVYKTFYLPCLIDLDLHADPNYKRRTPKGAEDLKDQEKEERRHTQRHRDIKALGIDHRHQFNLKSSLAPRGRYVVGHVQVIAMERLDMDLEEWIKNVLPVLTPRMLTVASLKLVALFKAMKANQLFHLDLKYNNLMVKIVPRGTIKQIERIYAIDFGLSCCIDLDDKKWGKQIEHAWPNPLGHVGWYLIGPSLPTSPLAAYYDVLTFLSESHGFAQKNPHVAAHFQHLTEHVLEYLLENNPDFPPEHAHTPERILIPLIISGHYHVDASRWGLFLKYYKDVAVELGLMDELRAKIRPARSATGKLKPNRM